MNEQLAQYLASDGNAGCEGTVDLTTTEQQELQSELQRIRGILARMTAAADEALAVWQRDGATMPAIWRKPLDKALSKLAEVCKEAA